MRIRILSIRTERKFMLYFIAVFMIFFVLYHLPYWILSCIRTFEMQASMKVDAFLRHKKSEPFFNREQWESYSHSRSSLLSPMAIPNNTATSHHLLTLFTTIKPSEERRTLHENTLRFWASLLPAVQPVLFYTEDEEPAFRARAEDMGWLVYKAPRLNQGLPIIKDMFEFVQNNVNTTAYFYGYANSDILFPVELCEVLMNILQMRANWIAERGLLLVGRRTDVLLSDLNNFDPPFSSNDLETKFTHMQEGSDLSLDYFITSHDKGFPFKELPDLVVGKPGWDNYLMTRALDHKLLTVDCSKVVRALHQTRDFSNHDIGWKSDKVCMNRDMLGFFYILKGSSECAEYYFTRKKNANITIPLQLHWRFWKNLFCYDRYLRYFSHYKSCQAVIFDKNNHK